MNFLISILIQDQEDHLEHLLPVELPLAPVLVLLHLIVMEVVTAKALELQLVQIVRLL